MPRTQNGFGRRLGRWLDRVGFTQDPFALYEADQESPHLPFFFVDRPYLHDVLGNPAHPQAAFLMAGRGGGKTATLEMVAYECERASFRRRVLAVRYNDFTPLLEQVEGDVKRITARHHVRVIVRYILKALAEAVPPTYLDRLEDADNRSLLTGYVQAFADPVSALTLHKLVPEEPTRLDWDALSPVETLEILAGLVTQLGPPPLPQAEEDVGLDAQSGVAWPASSGSQEQIRYQAVYILVDRVDETGCGPEAAVPLLRPLVSEGAMLKTPHVGFKFFLPTEVGDRLNRAVTLRPDRLCMRTITWNETSLRKMIELRLSYYSEGRVGRLEELCTSGAKPSVMDRLIGTCQGSPRTLLRLCRELIHHHIDQADEMSTLITHHELVETLQQFTYQLELEEAQLTPVATPRSPSTAPETPGAPPESGLYFDDSGHVWVDGEPLVPPLSRLEFRLLEILYRQAPEIVPHEALIEAVWPSLAWMTEKGSPAADEQNLRKLIARLRKRLPGERSRFVKNVRGRGYWLKRD